MAAYNIPYLSLAESTPNDVALDVFIKMNTSNVKLTPFDIVVAQVEAAAERSMHDLLDQITVDVPGLEDLGDLGTLLLDVSCLLSEKVASKANYLRLDFATLPDLWLSSVPALNELVDFLKTENIFDEARLRQAWCFPVIAALAAELPASGYGLGNGRTLLRYYMWRAFLTGRYASSTGTRSTTTS